MKQVIYILLILTTFLTGCSDEYSLETAEAGMPSCAESNIAHNNIYGNTNRSISTTINLDRYARTYAKENKERINPLHFNFYEEVVRPTGIHMKFIELRKRLCQDNPYTSYRSAHIYSLGMIYDRTRESYPEKYLTKTEFLDDIDGVIKNIYSIWKTDIRKIDHIEEEAFNSVTQDMFKKRLINKVKTSDSVFITPSLPKISNDLHEELRNKRSIANKKILEENRIENEKLNKAVHERYTAKSTLNELENSLQKTLRPYNHNEPFDTKTVENYIPYKIENLLESINDYPEQIYKIEANIALPNKFSTGENYQPIIDQLIKSKDLLDSNRSKYYTIYNIHREFKRKLESQNNKKDGYEAKIQSNNNYTDRINKNNKGKMNKLTLETLSLNKNKNLKYQKELKLLLQEINITQEDIKKSEQDIITFHKDIIDQLQEL